MLEYETPAPCDAETPADEERVNKAWCQLVSELRRRSGYWLPENIRAAIDAAKEPEDDRPERQQYP
jgi:hypothetical protein